MNQHTRSQYGEHIVEAWHALVRPPDAGARFREVDGLRALACLWVIALHTLSSLGSFWVRPEHDVHILDRAGFLEIQRSPALRWMLKGDLGVDMFFVLSGFLIARQLFLEIKRTGTVQVLDFYGRRLLRLYPAFAVAVLLYALLDGQNLRSIAATMAYLSNFVPVYDQFMLHAWSLSVEWQFYLVFPWLACWLFRGRVATSTALWLGLAASLAVRAYVVQHHALHIGLAGHPALDVRAAERFNSLFYDEPDVRCGALLCGVILAFFSVENRVTAFFKRSRWLAILSFFVLSLLALGVLVPAPVPDEGVAPNETVVFWFLVLYQPAFAAFIAFTMAAMQADWGPFRLLKRALSSRAFSPLAQLSYGAYLIHPLIIKSVYERWRDLPTDPGSLTMLGFGFMLVAFALAVPLYLFVEYPCLQMRSNEGLAKRTAVA